MRNTPPTRWIRSCIRRKIDRLEQTFNLIFVCFQTTFAALSQIILVDLYAKRLGNV